MKSYKPNSFTDMEWPKILASEFLVYPFEYGTLVIWLQFQINTIPNFKLFRPPFVIRILFHSSMSNV